MDMAFQIPIPDMTPEEARACKEVLLEQEAQLRYPERFGAAEALELGLAFARRVPNLPSGVSVTITREADGVVMFQWVADDKDAHNLEFAAGKRAAALEAGHAGPWTQLDMLERGETQGMWDRVPAYVPAGGAFPIRAGDEWVATLAVSGLAVGRDHELVVSVLEETLGKQAPRFACRVI
jgi:uncharacterized protein (UPF0303 family)